MRWTGRTALVAVTGVGVLAAVVISCGGQQVGSSAVDKVTHGKYLSIVLGCNDCHTPGSLYGAPDTTRLLSGSELGWQGPWGVSYPRNLTPDVETGIGSWSEADIITALRTGHRPDQSPLLPPMPWPMYAHLTNEDAQALAAYLKSIPPVQHKAPDKLPPGAAAPAALIFPPPPAWDAQNLPAPPAQPPAGEGERK